MRRACPWLPAVVNGELDEPGSLVEVLRDPGAIPVHHPEDALPSGVILVGGEAVPPNRLGVVQREPCAMFVHRLEVVIGHWWVPFCAL